MRHKPAQDWAILRYHVLRITVPIRGCVYLTVYTCTLFTCTERQPQHTALGIFFSLPFFSLSFSPRSFAPFLSRSPFSHSPSTHRRGRLARLLFAAGTRVSLAHTPEADRLQRVLKYRHAVHSLEWHTVVGLKDAGEVRGVTIPSLLSLSFY